MFLVSYPFCEKEKGAAAHMQCNETHSSANKKNQSLLFLKCTAVHKQRVVHYIVNVTHNSAKRKK